MKLVAQVWKKSFGLARCFFKVWIKEVFIKFWLTSPDFFKLSLKFFEGGNLGLQERYLVIDAHLLQSSYLTYRTKLLSEHRL